MSRSFVGIFFIFSICSAAVASPLKKPVVKVNGHRILVEVAVTPSEWKKGLMFREALGKNEGMLFLGEVDRPQSFWMKNTLVSLDIIFIDRFWKIVSIAENTSPLSEAPIPSLGEARHVLELVAGSAQRLGLKAKLRLDVEGLPAPFQPKSIK